MGLVSIAFSRRNREAIIKGVKRCTSRRTPKAVAGDMFQVLGGVYRVTRVEERRLRDVAETLYELEGYSSPEEFMRDWCRLHRMKSTSYPHGHQYWDTMVYVHHFEEAGC